jgi:hypothetical protein
MKPCSVPIPAAMTSALRMPSQSGRPWRIVMTARIVPATPDTEPAERSISPSSSTRTMPTAIVAPGTICWLRKYRFCAVRKLLFSDWNTTAMMTSPMITGHGPSSPERRRWRTTPTASRGAVGVPVPLRSCRAAVAVPAASLVVDALIVRPPYATC